MADEKEMKAPADPNAPTKEEAAAAKVAAREAELRERLAAKAEAARFVPVKHDD